MRAASLFALGGSIVLSACATSIARSGDSLPAAHGLASPTYQVGESPPGQADHGAEAVRAVQAALERRGYREADDARYRLEVAFAVAPTGLHVEQDAPASRRSKPVLCKRRHFRLVVALLDARDGAVLFRGTASDRRCGDLDPARLPALAEAALGDQS